MLQKLTIELVDRRVVDDSHADFRSQNLILLQQMTDGSFEQLLRKLTL
jgi:hypothetical protein